MQNYADFYFITASFKNTGSSNTCYMWHENVSHGCTDRICPFIRSAVKMKALVILYYMRKVEKTRLPVTVQFLVERTCSFNFTLHVPLTQDIKPIWRSLAFFNLKYDISIKWCGPYGTYHMVLNRPYIIGAIKSHMGRGFWSCDGHYGSIYHLIKI